MAMVPVQLDGHEIELSTPHLSSCGFDAIDHGWRNEPTARALPPLVMANTRCLDSGPRAADATTAARTGTISTAA